MVFHLFNIVVAIFFVYVLYRHSNYLRYSSLFILYWWFFCGLGYSIYHNSFTFSIVPFLWIFACALSVLGGETIGYHLKCKDKTEKQWIFSENTIYNILLGVAAFAVATYIGYFILLGLAGHLLSLKGWLSILNSSEMARNTESNDSLFLKLINIASYFSYLLYGHTYNYTKIKKSIVLKLLFFLRVVFGVMASAGKFGIISFIIFFASGFITTRMRVHGLKLAKIKYHKLIFYIVIVGGVLIFLMNHRAGKNVGFNRFLAYGFGEIPSFNYWFEYGIKEKTHGAQSFYGVYSHLFRGRAFSGKYSNYSISPIYPHVNTYTVFRAIINDFGKVGGIIMMELIGIAAGRCYRLLYYSGRANGIMTMLLVFLLMGFLMPLGYYLTPFLACILFVAFCTIFFRKRNTES